MKHIVAFLLLSHLSFAQTSFEQHKEVLLLMGSRFEITAVADSKEIAQDAVLASIQEIERIEALISSWQEDSQTSGINRQAGIRAVRVDKELFQLIERSKKISNLTQGAFDISFASMGRLYTFDREEHPLPSSAELEQRISKINWQDILLNHEEMSVFLKQKGMKIGFGGIGKGYAANKAKELIQNMPGVHGGLINASGDLIAFGETNKKGGWPIQVADPKDKLKSIGWLEIENMSVVTSGDYEKFFTNNNLRYAHIINPKTGLPSTGIKSVTVICPDAEIGDALATSIFILGKTEGIQLVNTLKNIEALIITDQDEIVTSRHLILNRY